MTKDYTKDIEQLQEQAEEVLHLFRLEKDGFADAYKNRNSEEMNEHSEQIIDYTKQFAKLFFPQRKWKSSMDLGKVKDFRKDRKLSDLAMSISRQAEYLKKDFVELNLKSFRDHADQAEKKMYLIFRRLEYIRDYGINSSPPTKPKVSQSHLITENTNSWKKWVQQEVKPKEEEDTTDPLDKIDQLFNDMDA